MSFETTFEARLSEAFAEYVLPAPVDVDPQAVTASVARLGRPRWFGLSSFASNHRWLTPVLIGLLLVALAVSVAVVGAWLLRSEPAPLPYTGVFVRATDMSQGRIRPTLLALSDGRVLISGGSPAEVYDPATNTTQVVAGDAPTGETNSRVLLTDGRVFLINFDSNATTSRAWIFDPVAMRFHDLAQVDDVPEDGFANSPPFGVKPALALLPDGQVLVAGGTDDVYKANILASALLFDPETETFSRTGSMTVPRRGQSMTALPDGRILVAGGSSFDSPRRSNGLPAKSTLISSAELYDPRTGTFTQTGDMARVVGPTDSVLMPDGRVLVYSAQPGPFADRPLNQPSTAMDIYDPATGTFTQSGFSDRGADSVNLMRDGSILLSGALHYTRRQDDLQSASGYYLFDLYRPWAAIFDPRTDSFVEVAAPRTNFPGTLTLPDGRVLFAGGVTYPDQPQSPGIWESVIQPWMEIFE